MKSQPQPQPQPIFYQGVHPAYYYGPPPPLIKGPIGPVKEEKKQTKPPGEEANPNRPQPKRSPTPSTLDARNLAQLPTANDIQYTPFKPKPLSLPNYASSEISFKGTFMDPDGDTNSIISRSTGVGATYDLLVRNPPRSVSRMSQCSVSTVKEAVPPPCIKTTPTAFTNHSYSHPNEDAIKALQTEWVEQTKLLKGSAEIPRIKLDFMPETPLPKALKEPNSTNNNSVAKRSNRSVSFDSESLAKVVKSLPEEKMETEKKSDLSEMEDSVKTNTILRRPPQKTVELQQQPNGYNNHTVSIPPTANGYYNGGIPPSILPTKLPLMSDQLYYPLKSDLSNDSRLQTISQSDLLTANWNILLSLSVLEILLGIILATLGICRLLLLSRWGIGVELVYGVYVTVAGALGVMGNCRKEFCLTSASFVMNILSCILALPPFILGLMATIPESFPGVKAENFYNSHEPFAVNIISSTVCLLALIVSVVTCAQGCSMGASIVKSLPMAITTPLGYHDYQMSSEKSGSPMSGPPNTV